MAVLCVIQDSHFVIIEVNLVDKGVHQSLTVFEVIHIALAELIEEETHLIEAGRKILCKRFSTKSRMALESRADSGLNPLITESHGGQSGMRAGTA